MSSTIDVAITTETSKYTPDSPQWRREVAALHSDLNRNVGPTAQRSTPTPGTRGGVVEVILALGASGALAGAVTCFRAWLARDKTRTLTVTWTDGDGNRQQLTVSGENLDQRSFAVLSESIGRMIEGR